MRKRGKVWMVVAMALAAAAPGAHAGGPTCFGRQATIVRGDGDNTIEGTSGVDVIHAGGGNDRVDGRGGNDYICGGPGNDELVGGGGAEHIKGNGGDDIIVGASGPNVLRGGVGNDWFYTGSSLGGRFYGEEGRDTISTIGRDCSTGVRIDLAAGTGSWPMCDGYEGHLELHGIENIEGSLKADVLRGSAARNEIHGTRGADILSGREGDDILRAQEGTDTLYGGDGDDTLDGGPGEDTGNGHAGTDDCISVEHATSCT